MKTKGIVNSPINNEYLQKIIEIEEFAKDNFDYLIKAIDSLFYNYIQECLHKDSSILIDCNQVYEIYEAKKVLELLGKYLNIIKDEQ